MKVYVVVEANHLLKNVSASAVYSRREDAEEHLIDPRRNWFADNAAVVELELDGELAKLEG